MSPDSRHLIKNILANLEGFEQMSREQLQFKARVTRDVLNVILTNEKENQEAEANIPPR